MQRHLIQQVLCPVAALLVEAVTALRAEKDSEIAALRAENDALRARIGSLNNW